MYLDELPSVRVTGMRRSGALTPDATRIAVTLQGDDGVPVSTKVGVARVRMRLAPFSCNSSGDIAAGALKSFDCMRVVQCADAAPGFATGASASLRFAALSIGRAAQGSAVPPQCNFAPPWAHGGGSRSLTAVTAPVRGSRESALLRGILAAFKDEPRTHAELPQGRGLQ
jgi:hypothetical protein